MLYFSHLIDLLFFHELILFNNNSDTSYITPLFGHLQKLKLTITPEFFTSLKNLAKVGGHLLDPHVNTLMSNLATLPFHQKKLINEELGISYDLNFCLIFRFENK